MRSYSLRGGPSPYTVRLPKFVNDQNTGAVQGVSCCASPARGHALANNLYSRGLFGIRKEFRAKAVYPGFDHQAKERQRQPPWWVNA